MEIFLKKLKLCMSFYAVLLGLSISGMVEWLGSEELFWAGVACCAVAGFCLWLIIKAYSLYTYLSEEEHQCETDI